MPSQHVGCQHKLPSTHISLLLIPVLTSKKKQLGSKAGEAESCTPAFPQRQNTSQTRPCQGKQVRAPGRASLHIAKPQQTHSPPASPVPFPTGTSLGNPHIFSILPCPRQGAWVSHLPPQFSRSPQNWEKLLQAFPLPRERQNQGCSDLCPLSRP